MPSGNRSSETPVCIRTALSKPSAFIAAALLASFLTACHFGNFQEYEKGSIAAHGVNWLGWGNCHYSNLAIGTSDKPFYETDAPFLIKLPDERILQSSQFSQQSIGAIQGVRARAVGDDCSDAWLRGTQSYELSYGTYPCEAVLSFYFKDSKLILFKYHCTASLADEKDLGLRIEKPDGKELYKMPLRERQLKALWGDADAKRTSWFL